MKKLSRSKDLIDRLGSLNEPVRLRILRLLESHELAVGEIAKVVQLPQSTVSRHLKVLADGAWLGRRPEGTATYFSLVPDDLDPGARALWAALRSQVQGLEETAEDDRRVRAVLAERRTDSLAFFGRVSGEWDQLRGELFGGGFTAVALLGLLRRDWTVADFGCGTGNAAELLAPVVERVIAIDLSRPMLEAARRRLEHCGNVEWLESPADRTGLAAGSVDAAVCVLLLHHLDHPGAALAEMRRVLRRERGGGKVLVVDMVSHAREEYRRLMGHKHLGFSGDEMDGLLRRAGFTETWYQELPSEPSAKGPGLFVATGSI